MARGMTTARMPRIQAMAWSSGPLVGPPRARARVASTAWVMGLLLAQVCSQPGIVATGTKVELVKAKGMTGRRLAVPAVSGGRTGRPVNAEIHDSQEAAARGRGR